LSIFGIFGFWADIFGFLVVGLLLGFGLLVLVCAGADSGVLLCWFCFISAIFAWVAAFLWLVLLGCVWVGLGVCCSFEVLLLRFREHVRYWDNLGCYRVSQCIVIVVFE